MSVLMIYKVKRASLVAQMVKSLPAVQETLILSLGQEDSLEKEMATHSSILAWRISQMGSLAGYSPWGHKELDMTDQLTHEVKNYFLVRTFIKNYFFPKSWFLRKAKIYLSEIPNYSPIRSKAH